MKQELVIEGMTCEACTAKMEYLFSGLLPVQTAKADLTKETVSLDTERTITVEEVATLLKPYPKYKLQVGNLNAVKPVTQTDFFSTYKPILILFGYLLAAGVIGWMQGGWMRGMEVFMGGFFLAFSFFKMLDIPAFANSYAMYDLVAMRFPIWGSIYVFVELALGIAYAAGADPVVTNAATALVMGISLPGVVLSVLQKKKIRCACLGTVFNLPMSTLTIVEDAIMLIMSIVMLGMKLL